MPGGLPALREEEARPKLRPCLFSSGRPWPVVSLAGRGLPLSSRISTGRANSPPRPAVPPPVCPGLPREAPCEPIAHPGAYGGKSPSIRYRAHGADTATQAGRFFAPPPAKRPAPGQGDGPKPLRADLPAQTAKEKREPATLADALKPAPASCPA